MHTIAMVYLLPVLFCCQGTLLNIGDQTLILIDPSYNDPADVKDYDVGSGSKGQTVGSCIYTGPKQYSCLAFDEASVQLVGNNTIVAINSSITLRSNIIFSNITNVSIIGYNKRVEILCEFISVISFENCNNVSIQNITWNQCGYSVDSIFVFLPDTNIVPNFDQDFFSFYYSGLSFKFCTNINLKSSTFKDSMVVINNAVSGTVCVDQIHFFSTNTLYFNTPLATGIIFHQNNQTKSNNSVVVKFTNTLFSQISSNSDNRALLLLYILVDDPDSTEHIA